jgi:hypothetical protein
VRRFTALSALVFLCATSVAHAHTVRATKAEINGGIMGKYSHYTRIARHDKLAMKSAQRHRNGDVYWLHYHAHKRVVAKLSAIRRFYLSTGGSYSRVAGVVCSLNWSPYSCSQVMQVVNCETGGKYRVDVQSGQFLGLFQMGSRERATYGHGSTVWAQANAAHRYFVASGRDFSPWQCLPTGGLRW